MKESMKYRLLGSFVLLFFAGLFLSFGFVVGRASTEGNVAFWVFKGIAVGFLAILAIAMLVTKGGFSIYFPLAIAGFASQIFPIFLRIGWKANHKVSIAALYICGVLLFLLIATSLLYTFAHQRFAKDENSAKKSSPLN